MKECRGKEGKPIYLAVKNKIFDVSGKPEMYGEGKSYHLFTGYDCSINLALMKFEPEYLNTYGTGSTELSPE